MEGSTRILICEDEAEEDFHSTVQTTGKHGTQTRASTRPVCSAAKEANVTDDLKEGHGLPPASGGVERQQLSIVSVCLRRR